MALMDIVAMGCPGYDNTRRRPVLVKKGLARQAFIWDIEQ